MFLEGFSIAFMITVKVLSKYIPPFPSIHWQYHWRFSFTFIVNEFSQRILPSYKDQLPDLHHNYSLVSIQGNSSRHLEDFLRHCQVSQRKIWTSHFALKGTRRSPMSTLCAMWYHLYYLQKPVKNTHGSKIPQSITYKYFKFMILEIRASMLECAKDTLSKETCSGPFSARFSTR